MHTFYVDLRNNAHKVWCEHLAAKAIREVAEAHFGKVTHHEHSVFNINGSGSGHVQAYIWLFAGALMLNSIQGENKRLCLGYTEGDEAAAELPAIQRLWRFTWKQIELERKCPPLYVPIAEQTKRESLRYLRALEKKHGVKIVENLWTCEMPAAFHGPEAAGYRACRKCLPCKRAIEIGLLPRSVNRRDTGPH